MAAVSGSRVDVVLFDLDDTLFAHRDSVARGLLAHLGAIGGFEAVDDASVVALWHALEEEHYHSYLVGTLDFEGQRRARARDFAAAHGLALAADASGAWFDTYFEQYRAAWHLHTDTLPMLAALAGHRLGIITNGEPSFQQRKLDQVGLAGHFEHVVASGALGITKPDARIFAHTCGLFGVPPGAAAYVGDRLETDAIGAASAGLLGVWLDRTGAASSDDLARATAEGVQVIQSLAELPGLLGTAASTSDNHPNG